MEKQEAIDFIIAEWGKNRSQAEITSDLSQRLGAPSEIVAGFVSRTITNFEPPEPVVSVDSTPEISTEEAAQADSTDSPSAQMELQPAEGLVQTSEPEMIQGPSSTDNLPPPAPVWDASALESITAKPLTPGEKAELEKWILAALAKNPRQSDVVMLVCERTGMNWNQAQRLVAEVKTKSRKKLNTRENIILIPLAILFIIAGLGLVYATSNDIYTFYLALSQPEALPAGLEVTIDRYTLLATGIGVTMFLGGVAGLIMAIRKQSE